MSNLNLSWIRSKSDKARAIKALLEAEFATKTSSYDFFAGCYGNPDSDLVLVPEVPSLRPKRIVAEAYSRRSEELWKTAWKVTVQDLLFRNALYRNKLIDDPMSDQPWTWGCWITDFVKRSEQTKAWDMMAASRRRALIKRGAMILMCELEALSREPKPAKCVVFVGREPSEYFKRYLGNHPWRFKTEWIYHYAWPKSEEGENEFFSRFEKVIKWYRKL